MEIKRTDWGEIITIPATKWNSEDKYQIRSVRRINYNNPHEQDLLNELEPLEQRARRRLLVLIHSLEQFYKRIADYPRQGDAFAEWERKNRMKWEEWFSDQSRELEDEVNSYSFQYADRSKHGWCL